MLIRRAGFVYYATYTYFTSTYFQWMPNHGRCAGEEFAAISGCAILSSYLLLFISFYLVTYRRESQENKRSGGRKRRNTATRATIDMARAEIPGGEEAVLLDVQSKAKKASGRENGATGSTRVTRSRKA